MSIDYNRKMQYPTNDNFVNRITEAEFVESKKGSMMIHYKAEVVQPESVSIDGKDVNIAGVETDQYLVTANFEADGSLDEEKTEASRERVKMFWDHCGQDSSKIDWDNPDIAWMKGVVVLTAMGCDVEPQRKSPTPEQKANRQQGDVMKNPITGKDLVYYKPKIVEVFGLQPGGVVGSASSSSKPY